MREKKKGRDNESRGERIETVGREGGRRMRDRDRGRKETRKRQSEGIYRG